MRFQSRFSTRCGATMIETLAAIAISILAIGAIYVGSITLQKSYRAAQQYAVTQAAQLRVIDYVALDLRRAIDYPQGNATGSTAGLPAGAVPAIDVLIPNYYDVSTPSKPKPRNPRVGPGGVIYYGQTAQDTIRVRYYTTNRVDSTGRTVNDIHRSETSNGVTKDTLLVSGADGFVLSFKPDDPKKQLLQTEITFPPIFRPFVNSGNVYRDGTATYATTIVRGKRK